MSEELHTLYLTTREALNILRGLHRLKDDSRISQEDRAENTLLYNQLQDWLANTLDS